MSNCRIVAEVGTAHGGKKEKARRLIGTAAEAGVDVVKFQWVIADEILHPLSGNIDLPGGSIPLFQRFKELELPAEFYHYLRQECLAAGVEFLCAPFGLKSLQGLKKMGVREIKIASPELNHIPLLNESRDMPSKILSSGVSTLADIEEAVNLAGDGITLLHCVTNYPAREEEYNLNLLPHLKALIGVPVGTSDHSMDPEIIPALTAALGGTLVEKHFTLSREDGGLDDPIAQPPEEMALLVKAVRRAEKEGLEATEERLSRIHGKEMIKNVMGTGKKVLARGESQYYKTTKRSILSVKDIPAGEIITNKNTALLRSETNLSPGLPPREWSAIIGHRAAKKIPAGTGLGWHHI